MIHEDNSAAGYFSGSAQWIKDAGTAVCTVESRRDSLERNADYLTKYHNKSWNGQLTVRAPLARI